MSKQTINIGASPNDGTGTPLRTSFDYTNQNFTELYTALGGGVGLPGATTQVIFNDGGTNLAGDAGLVYNKTTDALTVAGLVTAGSATITGDLTVDTNVLKVDSTLNKVGIGVATLTGLSTLNVAGDIALTSDLVVKNSGGTVQGYIFGSSGLNYRVVASNPHVWQEGGTDLMRLNATGLGVGDTPAYQIHARKDQAAFTTIAVDNQSGLASGTGSQFLLLDAGVNAGWFRRNRDGSGNTDIGYKDSLRFRGAITGTERTDMTIDATGNVGIGVTPSARFHSKAGAVTLGGIIETGGASSLLSFADTGTSSYTRVQVGSVGNTLVGMINGVQAMTLDASGNLLVGRTTMAGSERLHIEGSVTSFVSRFSNTSATTPSGLFVRYSSAAPNGTGDFFVRCDDNVATRFELRSNGGLANYSANNVNLSDARTKTDIKPLISYWNKIKALELVTFKYKDQTHDDDNIGLISQQVESVAPEFVSNDGFGQTPADGVPLKGIYTTDLYHGAIKALQEAMTRIEVLEAKLA